MCLNAGNVKNILNVFCFGGSWGSAQKLNTKDIIDITSVLSTFFDFHKGNVNKFGPPSPRSINIAHVGIKKWPKRWWC